jgi:hypothetical protein
MGTSYDRLYHMKAYYCSLNTGMIQLHAAVKMAFDYYLLFWLPGSF